MPITQDQMTIEQMQRAAGDGHRCGKCGSRLVVCWGGAYGYEGWILKCGADIDHDTITRHDQKEEKEIQQIMEARKLDSTSLMKMDENKMLERVGMARFPQDLTVQDKKLLAQVAITYGFDPLLNEISIYQGRPFVSIDGRYRKALETGELDGVETRPATRQERTDWEIPEGDFFFRCEVYRKGSSRPFVGWGRVRRSETVGGKGYKPVETNPQRMAEKRAESQALRKAFFLPLPSAEDIGSPDNESNGSKTINTDCIEGECIDAAAEPTGADSPIDLGWLKEQLDHLQAKKLSAWTNKAVVTRLNTLTGADARTPAEAVSYLTPEQAAIFTAEIREAVELA